MEQHNQEMREAVGKIEGCWSRHRDRQMFQLLKTAVQQTDESTTYDIMRKINPKEAKLIQDSVFNAKIRFRFSGEEFPPFVVFKIFVQSKGVRFMTGKKTIKVDTQAAVDACGLMGNRTFLDQIISDMCVEDHNKITDDFEVVTVNDCMKVDGKEVELIYFDTLGGEDPISLHLRPLSYPQTNVFLLCYSVEMRDSFEDIPDRWISEVRHYCPNVPVILCANKIDLRHDKEERMDLERRGTSFVTPEEGLEMARRIKAFAFFECSARVGSNVNKVFQEAVLAGYLVENERRKKCHIL